MTDVKFSCDFAKITLHFEFSDRHQTNFLFQEHLRLLSVICNPGMVNRHWLQIADLFGDQEFVIDTASSLSVMIDMKLNDKVLIWDFLEGL